MRTSEQGIALITAFEGCRLKAYKCLPTEQFYTVGYGHYGADVSPTMTITQAQALELLRTDLLKFEAKVSKYPHYYFTQNEFDALVSFAYNVGSIDGLTANGNRTKEQIAEKMPEYCKSGGRIIQGLVTRRLKEKMLFLGAVKGTTEPTIRKGARGDTVKKMQQALVNKGYRLTVDGIWGANTEEVFRAFQADYGLTVDGICGQMSWEKLNK